MLGNEARLLATQLLLFYLEKPAEFRQELTEALTALKPMSEAAVTKVMAELGLDQGTQAQCASPRKR